MSTIAPQDPELDDRDQQQFDEEVRRNTPGVLQVLAGGGIFAAVLLSAVALLVASGKPDANMMNPPASMPGVGAGQASTAPPAVVPARMLRVTVAGEVKLGPDGKKHDAFSQTEYVVKVGRPTRLRIDNQDSAPHTITSAGAGVSIVVKPGVHMYTMVATAPGRFEWHCVLPCDGGPNGWAMSHSGYMAGHITAS